jgi:hypothetical protein
MLESNVADGNQSIPQQRETWDGVTKSSTVGEDEAHQRNLLTDVCKRYDWPEALRMLENRSDLINSVRPDGHSLFTPLHQAAHGGAPVDVVERMLRLGAHRSICEAKGKRAVDIAIERSHTHLAQVLEPQFTWAVGPEVLSPIEKRFHKLIRTVSRGLAEEHRLRLPQLAPMLEVNHVRFFFAIPGMYGGFAYWLDDFSMSPRLISESFCRVVGGSALRHEITPYYCKKLDAGFDYS